MRQVVELDWSPEDEAAFEATFVGRHFSPMPDTSQLERGVDQPRPADLRNPRDDPKQ